MLKHLLLYLLLCLPLFAETTAQWIWRDKAAKVNEQLWIRKEFELAGNPTGGVLNVAGDDRFSLYINGKLALEEKSFVNTPLEASEFLRKGKNCIAAKLRNDVSSAGLLLLGELQLDNGEITLFTDATWHCKTPDGDSLDWIQCGYNDSDWKPCVTVRNVLDNHVWRNLIDYKRFLTKRELAEYYEKYHDMQELMVKGREATLKRLAEEVPPTGARFIRKNNVPYILLEGKDELIGAPYSNSAYYDGTDIFAFTYLHSLGKTGMRFFALKVLMADVWKEDGTVDTSKEEEQLLALITAIPDAYVNIHIKLVPPVWFTEKYPDEMIAYGTGATIRYRGDEVKDPVARPSMASEFWLKEAKRVDSQIIRNLEASPAGKRIIAYHHNLGVYAEWHQYGMQSQMPDVSKPMQRAFTRFLQERYGTDAALQKAWHDQTAALATATIPTPEQRLRRKDGELILSGEDCRITDFDECMGLSVNRCQDFFNRNAQETSRLHPVITGNYTGYFFGMKYPAVGWHLKTPDMLNSPYPSYHISPFCYSGHRKTGATGLPRAAFESYAFHNKVAFLEADNRTHLVEDRHAFAKDWDETLGQFSREFCNALTRGAAIWFYDFSKFWYNHPESLAHLAKLAKIWNEYPDATQVAEVAIVCDFSSVPYHAVAVNPNNYTYNIINTVATALHYTGSPFDAILTEDIIQGLAPRYKVYIFPNLVHVTPEKRACLEGLLSSGAKLLFVTSPEFKSDSPNAIFAEDYNVTTAQLRELFASEKVFCYNDDSRAVTFACRGLVGIHRKEGGPALLKLPKPAKRIRQLLTNEQVFPNGDTISFEHPESATSLFRIDWE